MSLAGAAERPPRGLTHVVTPGGATLFGAWADVQDADIDVQTCRIDLVAARGGQACRSGSSTPTRRPAKSVRRRRPERADPSDRDCDNLGRPEVDLPQTRVD
jgi:hypothetical protein